MTGADSARSTGLAHQHINGAWRPDRTGRSMADTDPYTDETLTEIVLADAHDCGDA